MIYATWSPAPESAPALGDMQDLINKLPWRKDAREEREERQARKVAAIEEEAQTLAEQVPSVARSVVGVGVLAALGLGLVWWATR